MAILGQSQPFWLGLLQFKKKYIYNWLPISQNNNGALYYEYFVHIFHNWFDFDDKKKCICTKLMQSD